MKKITSFFVHLVVLVAFIGFVVCVAVLDAVEPFTVEEKKL